MTSVEDLSEALFPIETARQQGMAPRRRATFSSGRVAAREALAAAGCAPEPIGDLDGAPIPPEGWRLSISHTDAIAVAIACRHDAAEGVGVDIEQIARMDMAYRRYVVRAGDQCPEEVGPADLTRGFALREAVFKALGPALQTTVRHIGLHWVENDRIDVTLHPAQPVALDYRVGVVDGHVLAVCLQHPSWT